MSISHNIIRLRRGSESEWANSQPQPGGEILKLGEPGYEKDTGRLKIGDGTTPWNSLPYINNGSPVDIEDLQDILGESGFLVGGSGINLVYDDAGNTLTIHSTGTNTVLNPGAYRLLTNDGTSNGVVANSGITFNPNGSVPNTPNDWVDSGFLRIISDQNSIVSPSGGGYTIANGVTINSVTYGDNLPNRIQLARFRGSETSPSGLKNGDVISVIRNFAPNISGVLYGSSRILVQAVGEPSGTNIYQPANITFNTTGGPEIYNNSLILRHDNIVSTNCSINTNTSLNDTKNYGLSLNCTSSGSGSGYLCNSLSFFPDSPTTNHTQEYIGNYTNVSVAIPSGIANSGAVVGSYNKIFRNDAANADSGYLDYLYGSLIRYGHYTQHNTTPYTNNAYGLNISPYRGYGTINNAYDIYLNFDSAPSGTITNHYGIYQAQNNPNYFAGSITVENGVSSPTPIFDRGAVSGNVSINYNINGQIQQIILGGSSTNFVLGAGWPTSHSVDVILELTVQSTTTVLWDIVDEWYNPVPIFNPGKYLVLLRSMGSSTIQGHYIGNRTSTNP